MLYRGNPLNRTKFFLNKGPPVNAQGQPAVLYKVSRRQRRRRLPVRRTATVALLAFTH